MTRPTATALLECTGKLIANPHTAQKQVDKNGHFAPALCFEILSENGQHTMLVEQYFAPDQAAACEAAAKELRKGDVVTFTVPVENIKRKALGVSPITKLATPSPQLAIPA